MKKIFNLVLAAFVLFSAASCAGTLGGDNGDGNGGGSSSQSFVVSVSNITATSATVSVTPSNDATYYFDIMDKATVDGYSTLSEFAEAYIAYLKEYAVSNGYTIAEILSSGNDSYTFADIDPATSYYAFAVGVNANGAVTSNVTVKAFTTLNSGSGSGVTSNNTFSVDVTNVTATGATISVTPSNNDTYYFDLVEKEVYDQFPNGATFAAEYIAYLKEYFESYGYTMADLLSSGSDSYTYEGDNALTPATNYVAFAVGVSTAGDVTTNITLKEFATLSSGSGSGGSDATSQNTFAISVSGVTSTSATVSVTPSNSDTYYFDVYPKDVADQNGGLDALAVDLVVYLKELYESYGYTLANALSSGADGYTYEGESALDPGTTYYAFAFGVDSDGNVTTGVTSQTFTTEASGSTGGGTTIGDKNINNLVEGSCTNYGDFYEVGATNYWIDLYTADYSEALILEVQAAASATSCVGTYPFGLTFEAGSAISGFIYDNYLYGSYWAAISSSGSVSEYAMINGGSVSISKDGNNYVIALDATTEDGSTITASYNGELVESSETLSLKSNASKRKSFRITSVNSFKKLGDKNIMLKPISKKLVSTPAVAPVMSVKKFANLEAKAPKLTVYKAFVK